MPLHDTTDRVWFLLMAATGLSTWVLSKDALGARVGAVLVVVVAALKVRLVLRHFMGLRTAPRLLQRLFDTWVLLVATLVAGLHLAATG